MKAGQAVDKQFLITNHYMKAFYTILLLIVSNVFMTFAWYGHLKLQEMKVISNWPLYAVILFSWMIALAEYSFQIPANRIGFIGNGGPFSLMQLKVIQEVVTLIIFTIFTTVLCLKENLCIGIILQLSFVWYWRYILSFINRMNVMSNGWNR